MGFLESHTRRKGANESLGFDTSATRQHDESRGSTTDRDSLEYSVCGSQTTLPLQSSTPVSADSRIIEHFEQIRTLISGFLQQKSTSGRQPFQEYVASEADKMSSAEYENFKIQSSMLSIMSTSRRQALPKRSATVTNESQRVGLLPPEAQPSTSSQTSAGSSNSHSVYCTPSPIGFGNPPPVNLQVADEGSRHNQEYLASYPTYHHRSSTSNSHISSKNSC